MGAVHHMISETSKRVGVESHVLRYWEEELDLSIGRTEMGHRYYTDEDIQLFCCIKELKEQGMLLREIKSILPEMLRAKEQLKEKRNITPDTEIHTENDVSLISGDLHPQLETLIRSLLLENNKVLEELISNGVTEKVSKDVDFLLQARSRQDEERYRKLDNLIRQQQSARKEMSKTSPAYTLRRLLGDV